MNDHKLKQLNSAAERKIKEAAEKFTSLPVAICSRGNVTWIPVHILKREGPITSASGTEEFTPIDCYRCPKCEKLIPMTNQISKVPDILISDCTMTNTDDPLTGQIILEGAKPEASVARWHDIPLFLPLKRVYYYIWKRSTSR